MKFADLCEEFIIQAQSGEPYDVENLPEETIPFYMIFLISLVVGFVIALIVTGVMRSRMKTVHMKPDAADYQKPGYISVSSGHTYGEAEGREFRWRWKQYPYKFFG